MPQADEACIFFESGDQRFDHLQTDSPDKFAQAPAASTTVLLTAILQHT